MLSTLVGIESGVCALIQRERERERVGERERERERESEKERESQRERERERERWLPAMVNEKISGDDLRNWSPDATYIGTDTVPELSSQRSHLSSHREITRGICCIPDTMTCSKHEASLLPWMKPVCHQALGVAFNVKSYRQYLTPTKTL